MDAEFWHQRWHSNEIGFHESDVNPLLTEHFDRLQLAPGSQVLVPLCGKSHDLTWLASQGYKVIGVELSRLAVESYFKDYPGEATITEHNELTAYTSGNVTLLVGDIFKVTGEILGTTQAIYDRAALVALPETMRSAYTQHLMAISQNAKQLLISYDYDQSRMSGPPFSISDHEIVQHYADHYSIELLKSQNVEGKLKGIAATEKVWLLERKK